MIILIDPWSTPSAKRPLPMSLLALASLLEGDLDYQIVDGNLASDPVERVLELAGERPLTAIGVTVMAGPQLLHAVDLSRRLKARLPYLPIVWGGYFPSQHAGTCLRDPAVDFVVHGQGELTFVELVRTLVRGGSLETIASLSCATTSARASARTTRRSAARSAATSARWSRRVLAQASDREEGVDRRAADRRDEIAR